MQSAQYNYVKPLLTPCQPLRSSSCLQGTATTHMLAVMGQSADQLFSTVNGQLLRIFGAAEEVAAREGGQPSSRGPKYALNIMLQGMNVPQIAAGLTSVGAAAAAVTALFGRLAAICPQACTGICTLQKCFIWASLAFCYHAPGIHSRLLCSCCACCAGHAARLGVPAAG